MGEGGAAGTEVSRFGDERMGGGPGGGRGGIPFV